MQQTETRGVHRNAQRAWHALINHYGERDMYILCLELHLTADRLCEMDGPEAPRHQAILRELGSDLERVLIARGYIDDPEDIRA